MYLKIVPAEKLNTHTHVLECDRIDYRIEFGTAVEVRKEAEEFLQPCCGPEGAEPVRTLCVGCCRGVMEPGTDKIRAALITVYQDGKPDLLVAAYECSAYLMNDKGVTVDKLQARYKL